MQVEEIEDDYFLTFEHEMTKEHHLSFVAYVMYDRVTLIRLYPEQDACVRLPKMCIRDRLSAEAQAEARFLMLSANNLLKPQDGNPVTVPSQDMVLGSYYLTLERDEPGAGKIFANMDEVLLALNEKVIGLHAPIKMRVTREINGVSKTGIIDCTAGRLIFNEPIPQDLGFVDRSDPAHELDLEVGFHVTKKELGKIIAKAIEKHGFTETAELLDQLKALGFKYSTQGAITISVSDMVIPKEKYEYIHATEERITDIEKQFKKGFITDDERYRLVINEWTKTTKDVTGALEKALDRVNPIDMMAHSGARGSMNQIRQLAGMRGLMANTAEMCIRDRRFPLYFLFRLLLRQTLY